MVSQRTPFLDALGEDVELAALFSEFERRGIDPRPALSFARSSQELKTNLRARLSIEQDPYGPTGTTAQMAPQGTREQLIAQADAAYADRVARNQPVLPPPGWGRVGAAALTALSPEAVLLGGLGRKIGGEGSLGTALEYAGYTAGPGALAGGVRGAVKTAAFSGAGAVAGEKAFGEKGKIIGGIAAPIAGPTLLKVGAKGAGAAVRGAGRYAEDIGKSNVGNVLLPAAPEGMSAGMAAKKIRFTPEFMKQVDEAANEKSLQAMRGNAPSGWDTPLPPSYRPDLTPGEAQKLLAAKSGKELDGIRHGIQRKYERLYGQAYNEIHGKWPSNNPYIVVGGKEEAQRALSGVVSEVPASELSIPPPAAPEGVSAGMAAKKIPSKDFRIVDARTHGGQTRRDQFAESIARRPFEIQDRNAGKWSSIPGASYATEEEAVAKLAEAQARKLSGMGQQEIAVPPQPETRAFARAAGEVPDALPVETPVIEGRGGRELGRGAYFSTSREQADKYARGVGALGTEQPHAVSGNVVERRLSPTAQIFSRDATVDTALHAELMREPRFAQVWQDNWTTAQPTRNNLWDAADESRLDLQGLLRQKGYEGASHPNYGGSQDISVWDDTAYSRTGEGTPIFRGQTELPVTPVKQIVTPGEARGVAATVDTSGAEAHRLRGLGQPASTAEQALEATSRRLPPNLRGATPRFKAATLSFQSDTDKALYIIGNPATHSKAHDAYVGWLEAQFPGTDVASAGQRVRAFVKQRAGSVSTGNIRIPDTGITPRPPTRAIEGVTYPSSENVPAGPRGSIPPREPQPPSGSAALPVEPRRPDIEFPGMERPALGQNLYGLKEIKTGMTRGNKIENAVLGPMQKFNRAGKLAFHQNTPEGAAVNRARAEAKPIIASQSTQLSHRQAVAVRKAFPDLEEDAFVPSLAGKVARVKGTPGLQDIRDFYPDYEPLLTAQQKAALDPIVKTHAEIKGLLNRLGIPIGSRASTQIGGGHYIARVSQGMLKPEDIRGVPTRGLFASQKKGFEREIKFLTMAEGRAAGVKYAGIEDALKAHYQQAGERALEKHVANYLTTAVDETNWPISVPRAGDMARGPVDLPVLAEYEFPEAIAESINKVLRNEGATVGAGSSAMEAVRILNRGYRSLRASLDNSVMGIQGLLPAHAHPIAAAKAAKLNLQAWKDPNVLARFMDNFDSVAAREGRLNSSQWVSEGTLHLGATTGEFGIEGLQKLPGFKQAGRAFGYTGDGLRLQVADVLLEQEMSGYSVFGIAKIGKGRTLDEIRARGDLAKIGEIVNNMTGVARKRFGGELGEILLFAPRFLQSRLETVGKGLISLRPGASIEQKIARRSLLKMIAIGTGLTVAINELNGEDTDFRPIVNGKKNPNFMRVRAFGRDWSFFGTWDSLLGLFIAAGHGDVEAAVRSQASGITTGVFDLLIADADFVGRSTISIENKIRWVGRQFAPFSGEQSAEGIGQIASGKPGDIASGTVAVASSFSGGKSSPVGFTDHADEIARQQYGTTWADMQAQRDAAEDKMVSAGNASSPEYNYIDARMDAIAEIVTKQFPNDLGGGVTLDAKRENLARQLYHRTYGELYVSQKASINKRILGITGQEFKFEINR